MLRAAGRHGACLCPAACAAPRTRERVAALESFRDHYGMEIATVAERPELTDVAWERTRDTFPEYNNHGDVLNRYWGRLTEERPDFQSPARRRR